MSKRVRLAETIMTDDERNDWVQVMGRAVCDSRRLPCYARFILHLLAWHEIDPQAEPASVETLIRSSRLKASEVEKALADAVRLGWVRVEGAEFILTIEDGLAAEVEDRKDVPIGNKDRLTSPGPDPVRLPSLRKRGMTAEQHRDASNKIRIMLAALSGMNKPVHHGYPFTHRVLTRWNRVVKDVEALQFELDEVAYAEHGGRVRYFGTTPSDAPDGKNRLARTGTNEHD